MKVKHASRALALVLAVAPACGADESAPEGSDAPATTTAHATTMPPATTMPSEVTTSVPSGEGTTTMPDRTDRTDRTPETLPETVPPQAVSPGTVTGEVPDELLAPVVGDAANRAGIDSGGVVVITGQAMLWSDGSLGCAEPGQVYTDAEVPGYWVVVEAAGVAFDYRLDDRGFFKLCTGPLPAPGDSSPSS